MEFESIEAVIFDCDGTLVDSETISLQVMVDFVAELGVELSHADALQRFAGKDLKLVIEELTPLMDRPAPDDFIPQFRVRQIAALTERLEPIDGAEEMLRKMPKPFCVASNAPLSKVRVCLETTGLIEYFDDARMFSAYQVNAWKPSPDVFLHSAAQMGVQASKCLVVEDSIFGIDAGIAAGMQVIAFDPAAELQSQLSERAELKFVRRLREIQDLFAGC